MRNSLVVGAVALALFVFCANLIVIATTDFQIKEITNLRPAQAVLLPGAGVYPDGSVSPVAHDRISAAAELYHRGLASKILISGDHGHKSYDEVNAFKNQLLKTGVPEKDIFMDHAGFSTYESVFRARSIFQVESAIIATQKFHLHRALFIANRLGLPASGISADRRLYLHRKKYALREILARAADFLEATIFRPAPKFGGPVISIEGDGRLTQD